MSHPKHGGARPGSGRKPKEGGYNKLLTMRSNAAELEKFAAIGGARWLHEAIASEYARQSVDYTAKAGSDITGIAEINPEDWKPGDLDVKVTALDDKGTVVVKGVIKLWISEKK